MIIDCISDLHGYYPELEGGDLLIVAGDLTATHSMEEFLIFCKWIDEQKYRKAVVIGGNHDEFLIGEDTQMIVNTMLPTVYLCDSGTESDGLKIWGSPWTNTFDGINPHCTAFTGDEELLASKFALIPDDIDILVTHGPPQGILDKTRRGTHVGSIELLAHLTRIRPLLHIYGHIHEGYGQIEHTWDGPHGTGRMMRYVNCSHVNEHYEPVNKPIRIVL